MMIAAWFNFDAPSFALSFLSVLFESVPFLLIGALMAGIIEVFVPARWMTNFLPKRMLPAILVSGLLGIVFPMCECGVVPVIRRLMKKGLPVSCAIAYLLASPVVNPIVAVSTFVAFRRPEQHPWQTVCYRLVLSYVVAVVVALVFSRLRPEQFLNQTVLDTLPGRQKRTGGFRIGSLAGSAAVAPFSLEGTEAGSGGPDALEALDALEDQLRPTFARRLLAALQRGVNDFLDVMVFVVVGSAVASVFNTAVNQRVIDPLASNQPLAIGSMMALAFILAVCSTSDAFIAATRVFEAFPFPARLAFLVFGPVFDLKLVFLYSLVFRRRYVLFLGVGLFLLIGLICWKMTTVNF